MIGKFFSSTGYRDWGRETLEGIGQPEGVDALDIEYTPNSAASDFPPRTTGEIPRVSSTDAYEQPPSVIGRIRERRAEEKAAGNTQSMKGFWYLLGATALIVPPVAGVTYAILKAKDTVRISPHINVHMPSLPPASWPKCLPPNQNFNFGSDDTAETIGDVEKYVNAHAPGMNYGPNDIANANPGMIDHPARDKKGNALPSFIIRVAGPQCVLLPEHPTHT